MTHRHEHRNPQDRAARLARRSFIGVLLAAVGGVGLALVRRFDPRPAPAARLEGIGVRRMGAGYIGSYAPPRRERGNL